VEMEDEYPTPQPFVIHFPSASQISKAYGRRWTSGIWGERGSDEATACRGSKGRGCMVVDWEWLQGIDGRRSRELNCRQLNRQGYQGLKIRAGEETGVKGREGDDDKMAGWEKTSVLERSIELYVCTSAIQIHLWFDGIGACWPGHREVRVAFFRGKSYKVFAGNMMSWLLFRVVQIRH
jgi:hypothetical protein